MNKLKLVEETDWLDKELWSDFIQFRKELREPLTPTGEKRALNKLKRMMDEGGDQTAMIEASIENNWKGIFYREKEIEKYKRTHSAGQNDDEGFIREAESRGIYAKPGESMQAFRTRVSQTR